MSILRTISLVPLLSVSFLASAEVEQKQLDGIWQSEGYGRIIKVQDGEFLLADVTKLSCIPVLDGELSMFGQNNVFVEDEQLIIKDGINKYQFNPISEPPASCVNQPSDEEKQSPLYNFNVLVDTFTDHYAYFEERNIDWAKLSSEYRAKISEQTTDAELYVLMSEMLEQFNDGHIGLQAPDDMGGAINALLQERAVPDSKQAQSEAAPQKRQRLTRRTMADHVANHYFDGTSAKKTIKSKHFGVLRWGILEGNIGYLQLNQMLGFADYVPNSEGMSLREYWTKYFGIGEEKTPAIHTAEELNGLTLAVEELMSDLKNTSSMIIDLRFNGGGKDEVGLYILSQFNGKEKVVFSKKAQHGAAFTQPNIISLAAVDAPYSAPVYLLIGDGSASATEIMALSSLALPQVKRVGSNTNGVFSDILEKSLPNGWELGLSNEVYLDLNNNSYESIGVSADVDLDYPEDRQGQYNAILDNLEQGDKAIETVKELEAAKD